MGGGGRDGFGMMLKIYSVPQSGERPPDAAHPFRSHLAGPVVLTGLGEGARERGAGRWRDGGVKPDHPIYGRRQPRHQARYRAGSRCTDAQAEFPQASVVVGRYGQRVGEPPPNGLIAGLLRKLQRGRTPPGRNGHPPR